VVTDRQAEAGAPTLDVRSVQEGLARLGYEPGPADGTLGRKTRDAIRLYERDRNLKETGTITPELMEELESVLGGG
jgi:peptidoglycan hydrolase-like protein with peptidoglycan-binding domain